MSSLPPDLEPVVAGLLDYAMRDIEWNFVLLTGGEKPVVRDQATMERLQEWVVATLTR